MGKPEDMHTWFFVYDEYMRRDDAMEKKETPKPQPHQQSSGLNNNPKQAHPTSLANHQPQHQQYGMNRGGMVNQGSKSVPNLDNNVPNTNETWPKKMSPPPPNYKNATQHPQSAQQKPHSLSNHHPQHHQQQYAGKEVNPYPNGQSLPNQNALHHNSASHQHPHHQLPYDQQKLENHHSHVHHMHDIYQAKQMHTDLNSSAVVNSERVGSTRVSYPPHNYNQLPYHGSQYVSGWIHQQPNPQQQMMNYGQHPNQHPYYYQKPNNAAGYGHSVHPVHHHSHHYSQQNPPIPQHHHHGYDNSTLLHQRHQSRSVPSVHDAVSGQSNITQPRGDNHSSRNSLHETTRLNRSSVSLRGNSMHDDLSSHGMDHFQPYQHQHRHPGGGGDYQQHQQFSTFLGAPFNQQVQQQHPCMAHQSKRQNQRGVFMRQASAPDIPPEHSLDNETDVYSEGFNNQHEFRSRSQGNLRRPTISKMHSIDDIGYKSEGSNSRYKRSSSGGANDFLPYNQELPPNGGPFHQCMGTTNPMYRRSGGDLTTLPPQQRPHSSFHGNMTATRNNGYLSDGEGYAIRNRRISKSGRYGGSHGSSPGANGPAAPFAYESQIESSRKSPYQQHVGLRQRHDNRNMGGKNIGYNSFANDRSGDDTRDDDDEDDDDEEDDDGYIGDNLGDKIPSHPQRRSSGNHHAIANISTTPADTDDLDDIEDEADDDEEHDDNIEDERDMEDTNEDGTTASATATVVAASVTAAAIKTTKTSNGSQKEDLIVSYSTYQAQTAAIGNSTNVSKTNRTKIKQSKQMPITNSQLNDKPGNTDVRGADSSCEEIFGTPIDSTPTVNKSSTKIARNNNNSGCKLEKEEGRLNVTKKSGRSSGTNNVKSNRNNSRQGIYSSDQSSTGADHAPLPPPPDQGMTSSQSSGIGRRRRGQMERADSQHSSSGGGGYRSEPGNCTSCGSGGKEM